MGSMDSPPPGSLPDLRDLALSVSRCSEVERARLDRGHPCAQVVGVQNDRAGEFQVPEGWAGALSTARIVFISSNPAISQDENYPLASWDDDQIVDFVTRRFDPEAGWTTGDRYVALDGRRVWVNFWANMRKRAAELLTNAVPYRDYVMTEVVHCKSKGEIGVSRASQHCFARHFDNIISVAPAPLVVVVGSQARDRLKESGFGLRAGFGAPGSAADEEDANLEVRRLGGQERVVAFLTPAAFGGRKTFADMYPGRLKHLCALVAGSVAPTDFFRSRLR